MNVLSVVLMHIQVQMCECVCVCVSGRTALCHMGAFVSCSDVAGGYSPSMLDAVRRARDTSKALTIQDPAHLTLTWEETFRLATLGGSQGIPTQTLGHSTVVVPLEAH